MCDGCPKSFHKHCLQQPNFSEGSDQWHCEVCRGLDLRKTCKSCSRAIADAELVKCSICDDQMHFECVRVPRELVQSGGWYWAHQKSEISLIE